MEGVTPQTRPDGDRVLLEAGVLAVAVLVPLPFGSVQPWAVLALEIAGAALFAVACLAGARGGPAPFPPRAAVLSVASILAVGAVQLIPVPKSWVVLAAPRTAALRAEVARVLPEILPRSLPVSLSPADTLDAVMRLSAYVALGLAAAVAFGRGGGAARRLMIAVALSGAFQALYGAAEYLTGHQHIFGYAKRYYLDSATGTFINRNHFAGYLALCLPMALGLAAGRDPAARSADGWRRRTVRFIQHGGTLRVLGFAATAMMWIGVFASYSRAGLAAALVATVLAVFGLARPRMLSVALLACLLPALYLSWLEVQAPGERFIDNADNIATLSGRLPAWRSAAELVPAQPLLGFGYGTFESAFRIAQPADLTGRWDHAHNDWLQALVEGGVVTGLLLSGIAVALAVSARRRLRSRPRDGRLAACLIAGLGAASFHALFDFGLRIPAVAALFAIQAGVLVGLSSATGIPDQIAAWRRRRSSAGVPTGEPEAAGPRRLP